MAKKKSSDPRPAPRDPDVEPRRPAREPIEPYRPDVPGRPSKRHPGRPEPVEADRGDVPSQADRLRSEQSSRGNPARVQGASRKSARLGGDTWRPAPERRSDTAPQRDGTTEWGDRDDGRIAGRPTLRGGSIARDTGSPEEE
jgi:hypothetical protein